MSCQKVLQFDQVIVQGGIRAATPGAVEVGPVPGDMDGERGQLIAGVLLRSHVLPVVRAADGGRLRREAGRSARGPRAGAAVPRTPDPTARP